MMVKNILTIIVLYSCLSQLHGQQLQFEYEVELNFNLQDVSIDSEGQLYLVSTNGELFKYSVKGDRISLFSPEKKGEITLVEAALGLKIFLFYRDFQEYLLLDRFLRPSTYYSFNPDHIGLVSLATISSDQSLWILDEADISIKKYEPRSNQVEISSPLNRVIPDMNSGFSFIKEYQNKLFLVDSINGVYILDNIGNYFKVISEKGIRKPGFLKNEIYFLDKGKVTLINFLTGTKKDILVPENPANTADVVRIFRNHLFLFEKSRILIFTMI